IRLLGKGGMGEVYEARQFNPDRPVALKVLAPWLANDEDALQRFMREAEVPANLDHPGIVRIIATGKTDDGVAYYTMHLVRGISLSELMRRNQEPAAAATIDQGGAARATPSIATLATSGNGLARIPPDTADFAAPILDDYALDRFTTAAHIGAQ